MTIESAVVDIMGANLETVCLYIFVNKAFVRVSKQNII